MVAVRVEPVASEIGPCSAVAPGGVDQAVSSGDVVRRRPYPRPALLAAGRRLLLRRNRSGPRLVRLPAQIVTMPAASRFMVCATDRRRERPIAPPARIPHLDNLQSDGIKLQRLPLGLLYSARPRPTAGQSRSSTLLRPLTASSPKHAPLTQRMHLIH